MRTSSSSSSSSSSFLFPFTLVIITLFCTNGANCARNRYPELEKLLTQLWIKDKNRLNIPQHIVLNLQGPIQGSREIPDRAPKPLFTFVDEARLNSTPTYRSFIALKDCFLPSLLDEDGDNPEKERLQEAFLESVIRTDVMMEAKRFLVERQLAPSDQNSFKSFLRTLWFSPYKRGKRENSCGFEHVFLGERRGKKVFGLHYWLTFYLREKSGEINYLGHSKQSRNPISALYTVAFRWDEIFLKDFDRFLVGTSPEFDMALYTVVFLTASQRTPKQFRLGVSLKYNNSRIAIQCYRMEPKKIGTCYIV